MDLDVLQQAVVICPNSYKKQLLAQAYQEKKMLNAKFMTLQQYQTNWFFEYGVQAIKYIVDQGNSVERAYELLNNLHYVDDTKVYHNPKLDELVKWKKQLDEKNYLTYNPMFRHYLSSKDVWVMGYGKLDTFSQKMLYGKQVHVLSTTAKNQSYVIHTCADIEEEVEFVYNRITDLLESGKDINHIYIMNANKDYESFFKRFNQYYGFTVEMEQQDSLLGTTIAKELIEMVKQGKTREEIYGYYAKKNQSAAKLIADLINRYVGYELLDVIDLLIYDLRYMRVSEKRHNVVRCVDLMHSFDSMDEVFLVGFNDRTPIMKRDTEFITDDIKLQLGMDLVEQINALTKENTLSYLSNIEHLTISYCEHSPFEVYNPSTLLDYMNYTREDIVSSVEYSEAFNRKRYGVQLDRLLKYYDKSQPNLDRYHCTYQTNQYRTYDNTFTGIHDQQKETLKNPNLSYSSMQMYNGCNFRYYLERILKLDSFETNYAAKLGTFCHALLQEYANQPQWFDFDAVWEELLEKNRLEDEEKRLNHNVKDEFFTNLAKEEMRKTVEALEKQRELTNLKHVKCEQKFELEVTSKIRFNGIIDKVLYQKAKDGSTIVQVVDYKTGSADTIDPNLFAYGLNLQLPSYWYLLQHSTDENLVPSSLRFGGLYLQSIINKEKNYNEKKTLQEMKEDSMLLHGFSTNDLERLQYCDMSLEENSSSTLIKSMALKKDGTLHGRSVSKTWSDETMDQLVQMVEDTIIRTGERILNGEFGINPKAIDGVNKTCQYCPYGTICYHKQSDTVYIKTEEGEE